MNILDTCSKFKLTSEKDDKDKMVLVVVKYKVLSYFSHSGFN